MYDPYFHRFVLPEDVTEALKKARFIAYPETKEQLLDMCYGPTNSARYDVTYPIAGLGTVKEAEETVNSMQRLVPETAETPGDAHVSAREEQAPKAAFVRMAEEQMAKAAQENGAASEQPAGGKPEEETGVNSNAQILALYSQGKNDVQIARKLGLGVGEVKLVIDLFNGQS